MIRMTCQCGEVLSISPSIPEIVNLQTITGVIFNHAIIEGNVCVKCGSIYLPILQGFDPAGFKFGMQKIEPPAEVSRIIKSN